MSRPPQFQGNEGCACLGGRGCACQGGRQAQPGIAAGRDISSGFPKSDEGVDI